MCYPGEFKPPILKEEEEKEEKKYPLLKIKGDTHSWWNHWLSHWEESRVDGWEIHNCEKEEQEEVEEEEKDEKEKEG